MMGTVCACSRLFRQLKKGTMLFPKIGTWFAILAVAAGISAFLDAQEPPTFKVRVNVVNVLATVRDRKGNIVSDLSKDDFVLEEDGKRQDIRYFSRQTDLPLTIGLLIDTSLSQRNLIEDERSASYQFLDQVLRPTQDQAFVIKFDFEAELLQDLTGSHSRLQKALDALDGPSDTLRPAIRRQPSDRRGDPFAQSWPGGQRRPGGGRQGSPWPGMSGIGTVLFDAVYLASNEILQKQEGRKAIILISDGVDNGSRLGDRDATEAAHRADTLVYGIRYYDWTAYSGFGGIRLGDEDSRGMEALKTLSKETGGRMFEITRKLRLMEIYDQIQEELRNQYNLGYTPSDIGGTAFRRITLRTKDRKLKVATRAGYYPKQR
ncbi:MAG: von Willebrand factor, type [Acidobacteria bacterium]|nr:von Willebrand factor, type [Acidobacteriota bacterium]